MEGHGGETRLVTHKVQQPAGRRHIWVFYTRPLARWLPPHIFYLQQSKRVFYSLAWPEAKGNHSRLGSSRPRGIDCKLKLQWESVGTLLPHSEAWRWWLYMHFHREQWSSKVIFLSTSCIGLSKRLRVQQQTKCYTNLQIQSQSQSQLQWHLQWQLQWSTWWSRSYLVHHETHLRMGPWKR